ncbi:MAG: thioredoxin family protein [Candidatus Kapabacteria bacterium]|nr:thioredoxin family protein [Candidatus Kapabacteria bacterium]
MNIKILGTGCAKCEALEKKVRHIVEAQGINAEISKVTDLKQIMSYGVMMTPGLVINEKVVSFGSIPPESQILNWLKENS